MKTEREQLQSQYEGKLFARPVMIVGREEIRKWNFDRTQIWAEDNIPDIKKSIRWLKKSGLLEWKPTHYRLDRYEIFWSRLEQCWVPCSVESWTIPIEQSLPENTILLEE